MTTEPKSQRRWMASVLQSVSTASDARPSARRSPRLSGPRDTTTSGVKSFTARLKAVTRPLLEAAE